MLKVNSGQVAVLGGLMINRISQDTNSVPWLADLPLIGEAFKSRKRESTKSELVIFLRPRVIREPSLEGDFRDFKGYLERGTTLTIPNPSIPFPR